MKNKEDLPTPVSAERLDRKSAGRPQDGVLDSLGKAITAPIAGAAHDDLLTEDLPPQRESSKGAAASKRP